MDWKRIFSKLTFVDVAAVTAALALCLAILCIVSSCWPWVCLSSLCISLSDSWTSIGMFICVSPVEVRLSDFIIDGLSVAFISFTLTWTSEDGEAKLNSKFWKQIYFFPILLRVWILSQFSFKLCHTIAFIHPVTHQVKRQTKQEIVCQYETKV